jgi:bacterioferritin-associated ferredoxin
MIVCICYEIRDSELAEALKNDSIEEFLKDRKAGSACGICTIMLKEIIEKSNMNKDA